MMRQKIERPGREASAWPAAQESRKSRHTRMRLTRSESWARKAEWIWSVLHRVPNSGKGAHIKQTHTHQNKVVKAKLSAH